MNKTPVSIAAAVLLLSSVHSSVSFAKSHRAPAQTEAEVRALCSTETSQRLADLDLHGETRFSEFKFDVDNATSSSVDFAEIGTDKRRGRHRKKVEPTPATPQMGQLLTMRAMGKEKAGWRNLLVRCGVNQGKVVTFTYEILTTNTAGTFPALPVVASASPASVDAAVPAAPATSAPSPTAAATSAAAPTPASATNTK